MKMNWVGGARSRICRTDIKSVKGQRKLQKEYFERRRLGIINHNGFGVSSKRNIPLKLKHSKFKISQDILDFQNHQQHNEDFVHGENVRAAFRVVNLNKKVSTLRPPDSGNLNVESVELPLSPVEKQSILNLSHSPSGHDKTRATISSERPPLPSNQFDAKVSHGNVKKKFQPPTNLHFFNEHEIENLPHSSLDTFALSNTIDLFGTTVEKPNKSLVMPPPSFALNNAEAKRKRSPVFHDEICQRMPRRLNSDSDYPLDDTASSYYSMTNEKNLFAFEEYHTSVTSHSPSDNRALKFDDFQLVPSQSSCSIRSGLNYIMKDAYQSDYETTANSFKLFSPLRFSDVDSADEIETDTEAYSRKLSDAFINESNKSERYNIYPIEKDYYSSKLQVFSDISTNRSSQCKDQAVFMDLNYDSNYKSGSYIFNAKNSLNQDNALDFIHRGKKTKTNASFKISPNPYSRSLEDVRIQNNKECSKALSFFNESSLNERLNAHSSNSHTQERNKWGRTGDSSVHDFSGTADINHNIILSTKSIPTFTTRGNTWKDNSAEDFHRRSTSVTNLHGKCFEPLHSSTPHQPICIKEDVLEMDIHKHVTNDSKKVRNKDKMYSMKDVLSEMMDLECQSMEPSQKNKKPSTKDLIQPFDKDQSVIFEILSDIISRVDMDIGTSNNTPVENVSQQQTQVSNNDNKTHSSTEITPHLQINNVDIESRLISIEHEMTNSADAGQIVETNGDMKGASATKLSKTEPTSITQSENQEISVNFDNASIHDNRHKTQSMDGKLWDKDTDTSNTQDQDNTNDRSIKVLTHTVSCVDSSYVIDDLNESVSRSSSNEERNRDNGNYTKGENDDLTNEKANYSDRNEYESVTVATQTTQKTFTDTVATQTTQKTFTDTVATQTTQKTFTDTVATQTTKKTFTDTACSPIIIFPCNNKETYFHNGKHHSQKKIYCLRSRFTDYNNLSKQEE